MNMSWKRAKTKTPGWAAFDPNKQQNQVTNHDPYPPISTNITHKNPSKNANLTGKSFSSVLTHSSNLPDIMIATNTQNPPSSLTENSQTTKSVKNNFSQVYEKLKELHPWADENLIGDIVTAVDNDFSKASVLLKEMTGSVRLQEKKQENTGVLNVCPDSILNDNNVALKIMIDSLSMIPMEPEWEDDDDDVYIIHRKDAIKAIRSASRYSKAAKEAYLRRDHATAQELSIKAQEQWSISEKLNAKASKEIFLIRNSENDEWKLDLHGLHASEAVEFLQQHLVKIESQVRSKRRLLEVVTGKGSHSRGEATLPIAIKSFLNENGYYYNEGRIGVITIQPKFRQLLTALSNT
ncbi:hypothetical protein LXL04_014633 [Taraxacum kok-saghyz]